jgi:hypothetical protein
MKKKKRMRSICDNGKWGKGAIITFAHVRTTTDFTGVLRTGWVDATMEFEEVSVPFCGVGDNFCE